MEYSWFTQWNISVGVCGLHPYGYVGNTRVSIRHSCHDVFPVSFFNLFTKEFDDK